MGWEDIIGQEMFSGEVYEDLDLSEIAFPSDQLTIQTLRSVYPDYFDRGLHRDRSIQPTFSHHHAGVAAGVEELRSLLFAERLIADFAYSGACGIPEPDAWNGERGLQHFKEMLAGLYVTTGIATGECHANELIRRIEQQAIAQAPALLR